MSIENLNVFPHSIKYIKSEEKKPQSGNKIKKYKVWKINITRDFTLTIVYPVNMKPHKPNGNRNCPRSWVLKITQL